MTKSELVKLVREKAENTSLAVAEKVLDATMASLASVLEKEGKVTLPGLGILKVLERKARTGRNPQTGENITIPAKKVVAFKPSKALSEKLNA